MSCQAYTEAFILYAIQWVPTACSPQWTCKCALTARAWATSKLALTDNMSTLCDVVFEGACMRGRPGLRFTSGALGSMGVDAAACLHSISKCVLRCIKLE